MNHTRREALKAGGGMTVLALLFAAGFLKPGDAIAAEWNKDAFNTKNIADTLKALGGGTASESKKPPGLPPSWMSLSALPSGAITVEL